jgi:putative transposase
MGKLLTAYSMYFNKKHGRSGRLFEGVFKATHVRSDDYLKYLLAYVHLNPIKLMDPNWEKAGTFDTEKVKDFLKSFKYSSFFDYVKEERRSENSILNKKAFPEYFEKYKDFENFIEDWLTYKAEYNKG